MSPAVNSSMGNPGGAGDVRLEQDDQALASLLERQQLFEKLSAIQRSISHGAPLQDVLDAITEGAAQLFGEESIVGLRVRDANDPDFCEIVSAYRVRDDLLNAIRRTPIDSGVGGRAILENRLVYIENYSEHPVALRAFARDRLQAAMAAPVEEAGEVVGSLVVASYDPDRRYTQTEQEALLAFAEHTSVALTDAKNVEALRQAQRDKEMFTAVVSHGLKTPLTAIMGALYALEKHHDKLDAAGREKMLRNARQRTEEIQRLIDRLLSGARASLAARKLEAQLSALVEDAVRGFDDGDRIVLARDTDVSVVTDADAICEIIGILVENAVSHSPLDTQIVVAATASRSDAVISVTNVGELPAQLDTGMLFEPFRKSDGSSGVGLGLYIASQLAAAVGGRIDVSAEGSAVTFSLTFPVDDR